MAKDEETSIQWVNGWMKLPDLYKNVDLNLYWRVRLYYFFYFMLKYLVCIIIHIPPIEILMKFYVLFFLVEFAFANIDFKLPGVTLDSSEITQTPSLKTIWTSTLSTGGDASSVRWSRTVRNSSQKGCRQNFNGTTCTGAWLYTVGASSVPEEQAPHDVEVGIGKISTL